MVSGEEEPGDADITDMRLTFSSIPSLSKRELTAEHYRMSNLSATANSLGLGSLEMTAKKCLEYIGVLGKGKHNHIYQPMVVSATDIAESTLALIVEVENLPAFHKPLTSGPSMWDGDEDRAEVAVSQDEVEVEPEPSPNPNQEENPVEGCEDRAPLAVPTKNNTVSRKRAFTSQLAQKKRKRKKSRG